MGWWRSMTLEFATMTVKLSVRLPDDVHAQTQEWAQRDGLSLNEWLAAAIERETVRRGLEALNDWAKAHPHHPAVDPARQAAIDADNARAAADWRRGAA
jgi:hypothetical protein